ncbi:MAG: hypothetical protein U5R31_11275 [Acidimicrobiia bacterium]|nr:hypothetical protein [Acidimicrobiia bacterium]
MGGRAGPGGCQPVARTPRASQLDLARAPRRRPRSRCSARDDVPAVGEGPYPLTLGPYGFFWLSLEHERHEHPLAPRDDDHDLPVVTVPNDWHDVVRGHARASLARVLPGFLARTRWYAGKARRHRSCSITEAIPLRPGRGSPRAYLFLVELDYVMGEPDHLRHPGRGGAWGCGGRGPRRPPLLGHRLGRGPRTSRSGPPARCAVRHRDGSAAARLDRQPPGHARSRRSAGRSRRPGRWHADVGDTEDLTPRVLRRRPEQHLDRLRNLGDAEGVPPGAGRTQSRSRDEPVPHR